jgi:hypothetical protein
MVFFGGEGVAKGTACDNLAGKVKVLIITVIRIIP